MFNRKQEIESYFIKRFLKQRPDYSDALGYNQLGQFVLFDLKSGTLDGETIKY